MAAARPAALGFKPHTGWTAVVALGGPAGAPEVLAKRRIDMAAGFGEAGVYHAGQGIPLAHAEALIRASAERFEHAARTGISALCADLRADGVEPAWGGVVGGSRALPTIEAVLRSHALVHAAEGELFRTVVARACGACGLRAALVAPKELLGRAARALGLGEDRVLARLAALGKASGRPWAQDQKEAALAAWIALAGGG
ncbi:MAG TPA: hypothetical protein VLU43_02960 [Anaeromyxobacteraceae bacterium]|nr:hypothetical protein [Anaeromyxobacteraceae bacterium]